jgi:hypothetical protein
MAQNTTTIDWETIKSLLPALGDVLIKAKTILDAQKANLIFKFICEVKEALINRGTLSAVQNMNVPTECQSIIQDLICYAEANGGTLDLKAVCEKLDEFGCQRVNLAAGTMLMTAIPALLQSAQAWYNIYSYKIDKYERRLERVRGQLNRVAETINMALNTNDTTEQRRILERAPNWLEDVKDTLDAICDELEGEIRKMSKMKSNSYLRAATNDASIVFNLFSIATMPSSLFTTASSLMAGGAVTIHAVCTIGDLMASGKANEILIELKNDLEKIKQYEVEQQELERRMNSILRP